MSFNLTPTSATYNSSGKFGASLNGGKATGSALIPSSGAFTVEVWLKGYGSNTNVAVGQLNCFWIGHDSAYKIVLHYGSGGTEITLNSNIALNDNLQHHVEWDYDPTTGSKFYVDGALVGSSATLMAAAGAIYTNNFEVRTFASGSFSYAGEVDELAVWSSVQHTAAFTPRTAAIANNSAGLLALYHFDNDANDSAAAATGATAVTLTGPTSGTVGVASSAFTVGANGTITGTVVLTPSDGGAGGTFAPTSVSISSGTPTATFTYTASSAGGKTISVANDGALSNPSSITYTAAATDTTAPAFQSAVVTNASPSIITITMNEALAASTPPASAFAVPGGKTVTSVAAPSGQTIALTVSSPYVYGDTITVTYTQPGSNPRLQDAAGNATASFGPSSVTNNVAATANNALSNGTANVLFSPYNWDIQASSAKTINAGAYFKAIFGGTTCTLNFDMTGIASPLPQISYRVDRFGAWISVPIAATVVITIPSDTADYANKGGHLLEVLVKSMTETQARWSTQATAVKLTGIVLDAGKTLGAPPALPLKAIFYGDSITEGVRTVNMTATNDTDRNDAGQGWSLEVGRILGAEVGNVGFGATGFNVSGSGSVPALPSSYNYLYSGVARSLASQPDFIVLMEGTNDGSDVTSAATTVLNGLLAATTTSKIIVLRPFNGTAHASQLQAAIAACSAPSRVTYVDTAGWFTTANSSDSLHPYGIENITHIAPLAAAAIKSALASTAALVARTVTLTINSAKDAPAANLSGIKVAAYDEASPELRTVARFNSASETTDSSAVMSFVMMSTLASGAKCGVSVQMPNGDNFDVQVPVV
jgi:lysophospholipase L1-like esterase